jgi:hypothetical protein
MIHDQCPHKVDFGRLAGDKIMRRHAESAVIENGFVWLPDEGRWVADTLAELTAFLLAATTTRSTRPHEALAWAKRRGSAEEWIEYYRGLAEDGY